MKYLAVILIFQGNMRQHALTHKTKDGTTNNGGSGGAGSGSSGSNRTKEISF